MKHKSGAKAEHVGDEEHPAAAALHRYTEHVSAALAVTRGDQHTLVYANAAFRNLSARDSEPLLGRPIVDAFAVRDTTGLTALLDRAFRTGVGFHDRRIGLVDESAPPLSCTIWPDVNSNGESEHLESKLESGWQSAKGTSKMGWNDAKNAVRDAWYRVERNQLN